MVRALLAAWLCAVPVAGLADEAAYQAATLASQNAFAAGDYATAALSEEAALKEARALAGNQPNDERVADAMNRLARTYMIQGRAAEALPLYQRALAIREARFGPDHPDVAVVLNNLAQYYGERDDYAQAEVLYRRAPAIREAKLAPDDLLLAISLNNLGYLYEKQGRHGEALPLYQRALAIREKVLGPEDRMVAVSLNNLGALYEKTGRVDEALAAYQRALAIREKALGPEHPDLATTLSNLAFLHANQKRPRAALPLYLRAVTIQEKSLGFAHPRLAITLANIGDLQMDMRRIDDAIVMYRSALRIDERAYGPDHSTVAAGLNSLSIAYAIEGRFDDSLAAIRRASTIGRALDVRGSAQLSGAGLSEQRQHAGWYLNHVDVLSTMLGRRPGEAAALIAESFEAAQLARASDTAGALARMAARFAGGDDELARSVRARQDAVLRWQAVDGAIVQASARAPGARDPQAEAKLRDELASLGARIAELDATLAQRYPDYQALTSVAPLPLAQAQALLGEREALLTYLIGYDQSFLWVVRKNDARLLVLKIGEPELTKTVAGLRRQLDPSDGILRPFSLEAAHQLYRQVFAPAEPWLAGVDNVMIVPDGALQSLPLGVLATVAPAAPAEAGSDYRNAPWLAKEYALSTLPSENSLRALRKFARGAPGDQAFIGIGDPLLDGGASSRGARPASLFPRGPVADVREVRRLQRLPETAAELRAIAGILGAAPGALVLGSQATEAAVKGMDLSRARVLAFATHGLMAGDFTTLAEPALVLTPPERGSERDDGLLTASEVARLKLNADWVILSACNTAAADGTPGAEGLSGLGKAFLYAGSRSLLVSHWPVASEATVRLTTGMFRAIAADARISKAEALRRSMLALMGDAKVPDYAHPGFWAPFVVVGDGGGL